MKAMTGCGSQEELKVKTLRLTLLLTPPSTPDAATHANNSSSHIPLLAQAGRNWPMSRFRTLQPRSQRELVIAKLDLRET
jgi:hypothetical protein